MTLYLQRLLDRAAARAHFAATPSTETRPALFSASPILSFDQRLGDARFAEDFGIVGAPPPEPDIPNMSDMPEAPLAAFVEPPAPPAASLLVPDQAAEPAGRERKPAAPRRRATRPSAAEPARMAEAAGRESSPSPEPKADRRRERQAPAIEARDRAAPPDRARPRLHRDDLGTAAAPAPAAPGPGRGQAGIVAPPPESGAATAMAARAEVAPPPSRVPGPESLEKPERARPAAPAPAPAPEEAAGPRPRGDTGAEAPATPVVPVVTPLAPLEAPPAPVGMRNIERIVSEAVRDALARQAAPPGPGPERASPETGAQARGPSKRPATAAEASVIGKLEGSAYSPMLFGVRRR
jgi:ribonuclease E